MDEKIKEVNHKTSTELQLKIIKLVNITHNEIHNTYWTELTRVSGLVSTDFDWMRPARDRPGH